MEVQNELWFYLLEAMGAEELEKAIRRLPAYREYARRYGSTKKTQVVVLSLDLLMDEYGLVLPDNTNLEAEVIAKEAQTEFEKTLTPKQRMIYDSRFEGKKNKEIAADNGYKDTGAIRYHTGELRKKYRKFTEE